MSLYLLCGLKDELDAPVQVSSLREQHLGRRQQPRHVAVMSAGMHDTLVLRLVWDVCCLSQRQGIHVSPQC